jgi:hypothetical protein
MTHCLTPVRLLSALAIVALSGSVRAASPQLPAAPAASAAPAAPALQGHFRFSERVAERQALDRSIEAAASEFFILARGIARSKLKAKNRIASWIEIRRSGDQLAVHFEGRQPMLAPADGRTAGRWQDPEGNTLSVRHRLEGPTLIQTVEAKEGSRTNRFSTMPGGGLRLEVEVTSPKLSRPLRYTLTYRAAGA